MKKTFIIILLGILAVFLISSSTSAETDEEKRIKLIEASQALQREIEAEKDYTGHNSLAVFFTDYKVAGNEVNPGLRLGINAPITNFSILFEGIYYRAEEKGDAFILVKFSPLEYQMFAPYVGAGAGVSGRANYQIFLGADISENFFLEAKYIDEEENLDESELAIAAGFQLKF